MNWKFWKSRFAYGNSAPMPEVPRWELERLVQHLKQELSFAQASKTIVQRVQPAEHPLTKDLTERFVQLEKDYEFLWRKHMDMLIEISELRSALYVERMKNAQHVQALSNAAVRKNDDLHSH